MKTLQIIVHCVSGNVIISDFTTKEKMQADFLEEQGAEVNGERIDKMVDELVAMIERLGDGLNKFSMMVDGRLRYINTANVEWIDVRIDLPDVSKVDGVPCESAKRVMKSGGKIDMIKTLRNQTGWGLKEAKEWVDRNCQQT